MVTKEEFIANSVAHQVGDLADVRLAMNADTIARARAVSSGMLLHWDHRAAAPDPFNGWQDSDGVLRKSGTKVNREKVAGALLSILEQRPDYSFFVDMADHRARSPVTPDGQVAPVFCFNRTKTKGQGRILWPLPSYHDLDGEEFLGRLDPDRVPWREKLDKCVWRGGPGNRGRLGKHGRGGAIRLLPLLRKFKKGDLSAEETEAALMSMSRYRVVKSFFDDPRFDIGYTDSDGIVLSEQPFIDRLERPRLSREDCQAYKYVLVLPGNDVASSFYWTMNSGSLGLVMDCEFETFASHHFKPWEHYVPFRRDLRDLEQNLRWCEDHPEECQAMVARAKAMCALLADRDLRQDIQRKVVRRVAQHLQS